MQKYLIVSGDGFFMRFVGNTPEMNSDPVPGVRLPKEEAEKIKDKIETLGFEAYLVPIREGRIPGKRFEY